jgi:flagellar hook-associated protein 3 FlgL
MVSQLNTLASRQYKLQNQIASGQKIHAPEDDPAAVQRTLSLRTEQQNVAQFKNNIDLLQERSTASFQKLTALKNISDRAGEIAIRAADGARPLDELTTLGNEVKELIKNAAALMNSKHREQFLFTGTKADQPPFTVTTDANGVVTAVTYQGNTNVAEMEIEQDATVAVDAPGANNSGTGARGLVTDSRVGADFFNHLISLQNNLLAGNRSAIGDTDRVALEKDEDNFIYHIGNMGSVQSRLETAGQLADKQSLSLTELISNEADADLADSIMQLNQTQTAYQAALASGAGLLKMSLMDYLR